MGANLINAAYLLAAVLFILGLKGLTSPRTAVRGNRLGALGMLLAAVATLVDRQIISYETIALGIAIGAVIGAIWAVRVQMTAMPQLVAAFNGFGGGASALVASAAIFMPGAMVGVPEIQVLVSSAPLRVHRVRDIERQPRRLGEAPGRPVLAAARAGPPST